MTETEKKEPAASVVVEAPATPAPVPTPAPQVVPIPPVVVNQVAPRSVQDLLLLIAAIGVVVVNVANVYTSKQTMDRVDTASEHATRERADSDKKLDVIHEQTNSNLTGLNDRLDKAYTKIESLEKLLSEEENKEKP